MSKFELYEDVKIQMWRRYYYTIEADTLEDAISEINVGNADCEDSEDIYEADYYMNPRDNNGEATQEIYDRSTDELVWDNKSEGI